ncbi:hypothetical protein SAMN05421664_1572 [Chryseobacterium soldanellicola]|uniref:TIGR04222 domain-containing protein n=1 Tax=Chryseobacterium soldanellicola TaxID=311333 RepID=A0A1H1AT17_9FLAO|nr:hypothetical protein [Chryseobacterium soldanellicola]SDQ42843.1 hypothetical protein SAMN05421664_1572 [Chryseobacterium soldanellicola]
METKMLLQNDSLWSRLQEFSLDAPNVDFPFSKKLAKEESWTVDFTKKAIEEYKKFVYLCCVLPNGASPSEIVDKVWHMHLIYTQNYWEEFCPNILKRKLHHHPSKGGFAEKDKHQNWFSDTLKNYKEIFNQEAPAEIWNNTIKHKQPVKSWLRILKISGLTGFLLMVYSCSDSTFNTLAIVFGSIISFFLLISFLSMILGVNTPKDQDKNDNSADGGGCSGGGGSCGGGCGGGCGGCGGCGG